MQLKYTEIKDWTKEQILEFDANIDRNRPVGEDKYTIGCPHCGHIPHAYWNWGAINLSWNDEDGQTDEVPCPKCDKIYTITQHVERTVTRTATLYGPN